MSLHKINRTLSNFLFILVLFNFFLFTLPVLAKPMAMVASPLVDNGFILPELNDKQLIKVEGYAIKADPYQKITFEVDSNDNLIVTTEVLLENGQYGTETTIFQNNGDGLIVTQIITVYNPKTRTTTTYKQTIYFN